jgi:hypothetical protein
MAYKKQLKDKDGNTIYPDVGLNLDDVVYSDDPTETTTTEPWIETGDIVNGAVTKNKINWSSMSEDNNNIRKIYTTTVSGTTDGNGFLAVNTSVIKPSNAIILGARGHGSNAGFYFPYTDVAQGRYTIRCLNWDFSAFGNSNRQCDIAYIMVN